MDEGQNGGQGTREGNAPDSQPKCASTPGEVTQTGQRTGAGSLEESER